jgi:peptidoglycan-associated lipoprotein
MKRFSLLLALSAFLVGCGPSRLPSDFANSGLGGGADSLDGRAAGFDRMAEAIRSGNIPPEAILATIYFDFDKYTVESKERAKLDAIAPRAKATKIIVAGYTDHFGTDEYNLGLSDRRAQSARDYLVKLGANQGNTEVMALGSQQADKSAAGRQSGAKDRKAIIVDVNYAGAITSGASKASTPKSGASKAAPAAPSGAPAPVTAL